jgi:hypothetical protein
MVFSATGEPTEANGLTGTDASGVFPRTGVTGGIRCPKQDRPSRLAQASFANTRAANGHCTRRGAASPNSGRRAHDDGRVAMKPYLWWWAFMLGIIVLVGWATGSLHTGTVVAQYLALVVIVLFLASMTIWGFVELRRRRSGVRVEDPLTLRPRSTPVRSILATVVLFAFSTFLAIDEASSGADRLAFAIAVLGMVLFGGRLLVVLVRMRSRNSSAP